MPGGALLFVSLVSAVVLYGGWWVMSAEERRLPEIVAEVPARLQQFVDVVAMAREVVRLPRSEAVPSSVGAASAAPPPAAVPAPQPQQQPQYSPAPAPMVDMMCVTRCTDLGYNVNFCRSKCEY